MYTMQMYTKVPNRRITDFFVNFIVYMCRVELLSFFSISFVVFLLVLFACYHIMWWIKLNILPRLSFGTIMSLHCRTNGAFPPKPTNCFQHAARGSINAANNELNSASLNAPESMGFFWSIRLHLTMEPWLNRAWSDAHWPFTDVWSQVLFSQFERRSVGY